MNREELDRKFLNSGREKEKLEIALERYFQLGEEETELKKRYGAYLDLRLRPGIQSLICQGENQKLDRLLREKNVAPAVLESFLSLASREGNRGAFFLLLREIERRKGFFEEESRQEEQKRRKGLAGRIWDLVLEALSLEAEKAFRVFKRTLKGPKPGLYTGTDGECFFFREQDLFSLYERKGIQGCCRLLLHSLFHILYFHTEEKRRGEEERLWSLACDVTAEYTIDCLGMEKLTGTMEPEAREFCRRLWKEKESLETEEVFQRLKAEEIDGERRKELEALFVRDSHQSWRQQKKREMRELLREVALLAKGEGEGGEGRSGGRGSLAEEEAQWYEVQEKRKRDYRRLLYRFMREREELQTDTESFDYISYLYGLFTYKNLPFVEPLEYTETRKLEELVIAIDTSSSCKKEEVQRFLEETWAILGKRENFFKKMKVHILQCDCCVQEDAVLTGEKEWKTYLRRMKIQGRGGTDFRPVFSYVEKLRRSGDLKALKGLLYFTDGDGIYPEEKTEYETIFLLTKEPPKDAKIPSWVRLVYMDERDKGEKP